MLGKESVESASHTVLVHALGRYDVDLERRVLRHWEHKSEKIQVVLLFLPPV